MAKKIKPNELETLIFSGAGALGVAYAGCINALEELGALDNLKTIGGSSAGSIISYALALGYSAEEIAYIVGHQNFGDFIEAYPPGKVLEERKWVKVNVQNLLTEKGYAKKHKSQAAYVLGSLVEFWSASNNTEVKKFLKKLCTDKYKKALTFQELYKADKQKRTLVITGCDLSTKQERYNSWQTTPDMLVHEAVLASMSIPTVFPPVTLKYPSKADPKVMQSCEVIDGGTLNNLPVNIGQGTPSLYIVIGEPIEKLGIHTKIEGFGGFLKALAGTIVNNPYQYIFSIPAVVEKTIQVPIPDVPNEENKPTALTFDLTEEQKDALMASGYGSVMKYFGKAK